MSWLCKNVCDVENFSEIPVKAYNDHTYKRTTRTFDLAVFREYVKYQRNVASHLPTEAERPHVVIDSGRRNAKRQILIIGGMGPLSDASISNAVAKSLGDSAVRLIVVSASPPRSEYMYIPVFMKCLITTIREAVNNVKDCECYMASNTIHTVFDSIQTVLSVSIPNLTLVNLASASAEYINKKYSGKIDRIILMTTKVSWSAELYEKLLTKFDIVRASRREIDSIQETVELGKQGTDSFDQIVVYIQKKISKNSKRTLIFMGCTDFAFTVPAGTSLTRRLQKRFAPASVVDSDKLFSRLIADGLQK
jgi:aspartate/glutamate racemase